MSTQNNNQSSGKTNVSREERNRKKKTRNIILIAVEIVILLLLAGVCVYLFGDSCGLGIGSKKGKGDSGSNNPFTNKVSDEDGIPECLMKPDCDDYFYCHGRKYLEVLNKYRKQGNE